jgi:transcriptional regulator with XRE-family HTH domain
MASPLRKAFSRWCRDTRIDLDITQRELAAAVGVSRSLIAAYECALVVPDLDMVDRIATAMDVHLEIIVRRPPILGLAHERDLLHARCSGYVDRRFRTAGFETRREVEVVDRRTHGWIDLLAFDRRTGRLIIVEIKTGFDDIGAIERQVGWYERLIGDQAREMGWRVRSMASWVLILATTEADDAIARQRDVFDISFPGRAAVMRSIVAGAPIAGTGRAVALIDPARRRRDWILPTRLDGRRTAAPYRDRAEAIAYLRGNAARARRLA